ncbi:hypothetical protein HGRIS_014903 [Hohenbuehelia grisea]|uniref:Uncharacterized protein n=1 Tax=Hohenbuehelia grisea TaxID=104357 RepID=A0ABR3JNZ6_9AGAR
MTSVSRNCETSTPFGMSSTISPMPVALNDCLFAARNCLSGISAKFSNSSRYGLMWREHPESKTRVRVLPLAPSSTCAASSAAAASSKASGIESHPSLPMFNHPTAENEPISLLLSRDASLPTSQSNLRAA